VNLPVPPEILFAAKPIERLNAARALPDDVRRQVCCHWPRDFPQAHGARNAWLITVGPSPGLGKSRRKAGQISTTTELPSLGTPCEFFRTWCTRFGSTLLAVVERAFAKAGLDSDAARSLFLHINLNLTLAGLEARIPEGDLGAGLPRLRLVIQEVKPRLIVALTRTVYRVISNGFAQGKILQGATVGAQVTHKEETGGRLYSWDTCLVKCPGFDPILVTGVLQHPSRASTVKDYKGVVGDYLASCVGQFEDS